MKLKSIEMLSRAAIILPKAFHIRMSVPPHGERSPGGSGHLSNTLPNGNTPHGDRGAGVPAHPQERPPETTRIVEQAPSAASYLQQPYERHVAGADRSTIHHQPHSNAAQSLPYARQQSNSARGGGNHHHQHHHHPLHNPQSHPIPNATYAQAQRQNTRDPPLPPPPSMLQVDVLEAQAASISANDEDEVEYDDGANDHDLESSMALSRASSGAMSKGSNSRRHSRAEHAAQNQRKISRPMNAFMIFAKFHRKQLQAANAHLDNKSISTMLGEKWALLPYDGREIYYQEAKRIADLHKIAFPEWRFTRDTSKKKSKQSSPSPAPEKPPPTVLGYPPGSVKRPAGVFVTPEPPPKQQARAAKLQQHSLSSAQYDDDQAARAAGPLDAASRGPSLDQHNDVPHTTRPSPHTTRPLAPPPAPSLSPSASASASRQMYLPSYDEAGFRVPPPPVKDAPEPAYRPAAAPSNGSSMASIQYLQELAMTRSRHYVHAPPPYRAPPSYAAVVAQRQLEARNMFQPPHYPTDLPWSTDSARLSPPAFPNPH